MFIQNEVNRRFLKNGINDGFGSKAQKSFDSIATGGSRLKLLSKKVALVSLLEDLKSSSSKWMESLDFTLKDFYWQDGYGSFSVNPSQVDVVVEYISNQYDYDRKKTFQDEYRTFLKKHKVEFDVRFVWD